MYEGFTSEEDIMSKWLFALVYHAYYYSRDKVFEIIEDIYEEFDYTQEICNLIFYMPCDESLSIEDRLLRYIEQNRNLWCK